MAVALNDDALPALLDRLQRAHNERDWDEMRSVVSPDFVFVDHRPAGFGETVGVEAWVSFLKTAIDLVPDRRVVINEDVRGSDWLHYIRIEGSDAYGGPVEWEFIGLWYAEGGRITRSEVFDVNDLESAVRRAGELRKVS